MKVLVAMLGCVAAVRVPGGYDLAEECIEVAQGPVDVSKLQKCGPPAAPQIQTYAMSVNVEGTDLMTQMNTSYTVPALPTEYDGQVVYFWPGFKSSKPQMGYPVLQPVLQYGQHGPDWEFQSWFVDGNKGIARTGKVVKAKPGDFLTSYMLYDKTSEMWTVYSKNTANNEASVLKISRAETTGVDFHYAMLVMETIIRKEGDCKLYPRATNVTFSNVIVNNEPVPKWNTVYTEQHCSENVTVLPNNVVRFGFRGQ